MRRRMHEWPFQRLPMLNGVIWATVLMGVLMMCWIVVILAVINARPA